jgi:hypothetical protein
MCMHSMAATFFFQGQLILNHGFHGGGGRHPSLFPTMID